jgi:glycosyltransferase involved in cell wall biosynthesis
MALLLPGEEDFGIAPVEAQACGRPVVAFGRGGALETVIDGETGVLFSELTAESIRAALERVTRMRVDSARLRDHAQRFSREQHMQHIRDTIADTLAAPAGTRW